MYKIVKATASHRAVLVSLLKQEKLPVQDLPDELSHFFVALLGEQVVGVIGLEQYASLGLLRSLAVGQPYRNQGMAARLIATLEQYAAAAGIEMLFLLTETAPAYFERKGYQRVTRETVPEALKASSEFSYTCPVSAIVMKKILSKKIYS